MRTFAVGAVLAVGVLGGCGGTTEAGPPPSPSTTPSASPSPTAPVMPDAARENTKAGAVAFVRHYVDLINHAQATGDTRALAAVEDKGCKSCADVRRFLTRLYGSGGHFEGGRARVIRLLDVVAPSEFGDYAVDLLVAVQPSKVVRPGSTPSGAPGARNTLGFYPDWSGGEWKVAQWTRAK